MPVLKARKGDGTWEIIGLSGPTGLKGPVGDKGATGAVGDKGPAGDPGSKGSTGAPGNKGLKGPKGTDHYWQLRVGAISVTPVANTNTSGRETFTAAFRVTPNVVASARSSVIGTTVTNIAVNNIDVNGFDAVVYRSNTTATTVDYIAVAER